MYQSGEIRRANNPTEALAEDMSRNAEVYAARDRALLDAVSPGGAWADLMVLPRPAPRRGRRVVAA